MKLGWLQVIVICYCDLLRIWVQEEISVRYISNTLDSKYGLPQPGQLV